MKRNLSIAVLVFLISLLTMFLSQNKYSTLGLRLNFQGVEEGRYSNGEYLDEQDLLNRELLKKVYEKYDFLQVYSFEEVLSGFEVRIFNNFFEVKNAENRIKNGLEINRSLDRLFINIYLDLSKNEKELVLKQLATCFKEKKIDTNLKREFLGDYYYLNYSENYDLNAKVKALETKVDALQYFLESKQGNRDNVLGEYNNILIDIDIFKRVNIRRVKDRLRDARVVLNIENIRSIKEEELKALELLKRKKQGEKQVLLYMLENYKPDQDTLIIFGESGNQRLNTNTEKKYYTNLIEKTSNIGVEIAKIAEDISYIQEELSELREDVKISSEISNDLQTMLTIHNERVDRVNQLVFEEQQIYYANQIMLDDVQHKSNFSIKKSGFIGIILSGIAFLLGFLFDKKNKK